MVELSTASPAQSAQEVHGIGEIGGIKGREELECISSREKLLRENNKM